MVVGPSKHIIAYAALPRFSLIMKLAICCFCSKLQVQYGQLQACFAELGTDQKECVVQMLYKLECKGRKILNEQDCPLLSSSTHLRTIATANVISATSIVHECGDNCKVEIKRKRRKIERENMDTNTWTLTHNVTNGLFALNIYCLNTIL